MTLRPTRRFALSLAAALPGLALFPAAPRPARAAAFPGAAAIAVLMSDLHSAQERAAAALGALDRVLAANAGTRALIVVNGDVFERGNAIALRSMGAAAAAGPLTRYPAAAPPAACRPAALGSRPACSPAPRPAPGLRAA